MKRKFSYKIRFDNIILLVLGFGLALFDMNMLKDGLKGIAGGDTNLTMASLMAFAIATVANTFALEWGKTNGETRAEHVINKKSLFAFLAWIAFGFGYVLIETIKTINQIDTSNFSWSNQIAQYVLLFLSYTFSGLAIQKASREIWDADASACRASENEFKLLVRQAARDDSKINYMLTILENYNQNYESLNEQYEKQKDAIRHAEDSVINEILGKTLQENPEITPSEARKVVEQAKNDFSK